MDPNQPIYLYINSTGTTRDDGETGFDMKLINVNRTCKVTKVMPLSLLFGFFLRNKIHFSIVCDLSLHFMFQGGQVVKYTTMLACGNYHGVVGFAKGKGLAIPIALQKQKSDYFTSICCHSETLVATFGSIHELTSSDGLNPLVVDDRALAADALPLEGGRWCNNVMTCLS
ncbi:uncharacterized protein LOC131235299 [Magnolia sinica]|uniref:uncharacterized protein LOC131235299 n=1 Tax=Magnolia sinica TaxID=86752 RepID=UPI00265B6327|nr:uncharacterized protein LOC131235299 [Magnolia sinica]